MTEIKFKSGESGTVEYEDGHIALQAGFNYEVKESKVLISNFKITRR